ncbi:MAG: CBS domain-containing protein [Caldilineae bacterium]|nr:MAG: CBS domain-containing protein [Caldilineae bacterium]
MGIRNAQPLWQHRRRRPERPAGRIACSLPDTSLGVIMTSRTLAQQPAQRLCIYIGESDRWRGKALYAALLETIKAQGLAGATVTRGLAGFGAHSTIHTATVLRLSLDLPLRIEVIDTPDKIAQALDVIAPMVQEGLITIEDVHVIKYTHRYLNPLPADRQVAEVMTRDVDHLRADASVAEAWQTMLEHGRKALPVVDETGRVAGMLTDEDLLERDGLRQRLSVAARLDHDTLSEEMEQLKTSSLTVADVMTAPAVTAHQDEPLGVAVARMIRRGLKRVPVVDRRGRLVGVLSRVDILAQVLDSEVQKSVAEAPHGSARTLQDIMLAEIPTVSVHAPLAEIVHRFLAAGSHRLIVVDDEMHPLGLISDADVVARVRPGARRSMLQALLGREPSPAAEEVTAADLMSPAVLTAGPDTPLVQAIRQMLDQGRKWMVVVDSEGRAIGLVDRHVLFRALAEV